MTKFCAAFEMVPKVGDERGPPPEMTLFFCYWLV